MRERERGGWTMDLLAEKKRKKTSCRHLTCPSSYIRAVPLLLQVYVLYPETPINYVY